MVRIIILRGSFVIRSGGTAASSIFDVAVVIVSNSANVSVVSLASAMSVAVYSFYSVHLSRARASVKFNVVVVRRSVFITSGFSK